MESKQSYISLRHIDKVYDNNVQAVFDFNLDINEHEFIIFVGPSGCGKSTTLRMVAGLEEITEGELYIDGRLVNDVHPKDRDIAMVFQSYALYPHMSVYENMAFGLRIKRIPKAEIDQRIQKAAEILGLTPYLKRKPKALSGGQRQRVALGRAIVREPRVFLMDEPLSNLDAKLRVQMRSEITKIHKNVGATTIYVTHDQTEAMTMGDRIVVMKDGYVQQIGTPNDIYTNPKNIFVATFIGSPAMNILTANYDKGLVTLTNGFAKQLTKVEIAKHDSFYFKFKDEVLGKIEKNNKFIEFKVERYTKPALYKLKNQYVDIKEKFDLKILVEKNKVRKYKEKILANESNETLIANLEGAIADQEAIIEQIKENQKAALAEIEAQVAALDATLSAEIESKGISEETKAKINTLLSKDKEYQAAVEEGERLNNLLSKIEGIIAGNPHNVKLGVRPEDIYLQQDANKENPSPEFNSECDVCELLGHEKIVYSYYNDEQIIVKINAKWNVQPGDQLVYSANLEKVHIFDEDNTDNILFEEK